MAGRDYLGALREREFRLLFIGQSVSLLGDHVVYLAIVFAVLQDLHGSPTDVGLVLAAQSLPTVLLLVFAGVWGDRLPRQKVMLASDLVRALAQGATAALVLAGAARLWEIASLQALYGAAEAFFNPAATALVPDTVSPAKLQQANGLLATAHNLSDVIGPSAATLLVVFANPGIAIAFDAATFLVSAASLTMLRVAGPRGAGEGSRSFARDLLEGWRELRIRTWLWVMILYSSLFMMISSAPMSVLGPAIARQRLGGPGAWGTIIVAAGLGALLGGVLGMRVRPARPMIVCALLAATASLPIALLGIPASVPVLAASRFASGVCLGLLAPIWQTAFQEHVPAPVRSRVGAYDWMGSLALLPLGLVIAGPVALAVGDRATLLGAAAWVLASSLVVLAVPSVRALRRVEARPATSRLAE